MLELIAIGAPNKEPKKIRLELSQTDYLISCDANADVCLEDLSVDLMQAKIVNKNGNYYFIDLGNTNISFLNNAPIETNREYPLKRGDSIGVGESMLVISDIHTEAAAIASTKIKHQDTSSKIPTDTSILNRSLNSGYWQKGEITVECVKIFNETEDAKTFSFKAASTLFEYKAGQFITLILDIDGEEVVRSYSISSAPSRPNLLEITVKRVPGGRVSNWLHDHLTVGSQILIDGPNGKFTCIDVDQPKVLMISAGSGITPMMSMSRWFLDTASTRDIIFFHSARTPKDIIFRQELELISANNMNFQLFISITRPELGHPWLGLKGRLDRSILQAIAPDFLERNIYVCGPQEFMSATKQMMFELGFSMQNYYEESFGGSKSPTKVQQPSPSKPSFRTNLLEIPRFSNQFKDLAGLTNSSDKPPKVVPTFPASKSLQSVVVFKKTGKEVSWQDEETILDMALREEVKIRFSCRTGSCGTCKKMKLAGEVKYKSDPEALDESEINEGFILTCISIPVGRVEIDA